MKRINRKIVFYIDTMEHQGGAQRVMSVLVSELSGRGEDITLINDFPTGLREYDLDKKVKRLYLDNSNKGGVLSKNVKRIVRLRRYIKESRADIIISFLGRPNIRLILANVGLKSKIIISVRNNPASEYGKRGIKRRIIDFLYGLSDGVVFQTEEERDYFSPRIRTKSTIILNPIDDKFYNVKRINYSNNIVTIGRLSKQKNHRLLIDAFAEIWKDYPDKILYLYGEGELRTELETYIEHLDLSSHIFMPGKIEDVPGALSSTELFILTSDYEGLPNALMEAMAAGVPVISTDCEGGGPRSLIENGKNGFLIKQGSVKELINKVKELFENENELEQISICAKKSAERFRVNSIIDEWCLFMNSVY